MQKSEILLETVEIPYEKPDWNCFLKENPLDFEEKFFVFFDEKSRKNNDFLIRNSLSRQIFEIVRENAGFKITFNNLMHILQKYRNIIEELMRFKAANA